MKEIQSPELLKPCCDKGDGGDTRQKDGWHCLPVLLQGAQLYKDPCLKPDVYETSQLHFTEASSLPSFSLETAKVLAEMSPYVLPNPHTAS